VPAADDRPFSPRELHVWEGFLASHSRLTRHLSAALERECRLTVSEFEVLTALEAVHPGGLRMTDLADRVQLTPSGLSRLVARLEHRGLVLRGPDETDQRASCVSMTEEGTVLLRGASAGHRARVRECFLGRLGPQDRQALAALWERLGP